MPLNTTNMSLAIPPQTVIDVVADVYGQSAVLQLAQTRQMQAAVEDTVSAGDFTWPAGMANVPELGAKPEATGTLSTSQLIANKMAVFVVVSDELVEESAVDIVDYYQDAITQRMAFLIDYHAIHGGGPFGTQNLTAAADGAGNVVTKGAGVDRAADMSRLLNLVEADGFFPNGYLADLRLKGELRDLRDANRRPVYSESLTTDIPDQLHGHPIYYQGRNVFMNNPSSAGPPAVPGSVQSVSGDFTQYLVGIRSNLTFSLHNEGTVGTTNLLEQNATALRAEMRIGAAVLNAEAFSILRNA